MAEIVVSPLLQVIFEKLYSEGLKIVARSKGIHSQLNKWETSLSHIQALLNDASHKEVTNESVKRWLDRLQHLFYDIDDLLDELATEAMSREESKVRNLIPGCCTSFLLSSRMHGKLHNITTTLQELRDQTTSLDLIMKLGKSESINTTPYQTSLDTGLVGRQRDKKALLQKLLRDAESRDENFSIVPIVGMGGVGKTALARFLYNEPHVDRHFQVKSWVSVSDDFDIFNITNLIFQSLEGLGQKEKQNFADLNLLQLELKKKLSNKRFLLVLDNVWSESYSDWEILARPFLVGAPGSKVLMTTRKLTLLTQLGYNQPYRISILSDEDALSLLAIHALGESNFDSHPNLRSYGEGIVKKCEGLPLALISLGRLLRTKEDREEWEEVLNNEIWNLRLPDKDKIIPALRLSYQDLSAPLKRLFVYCTLFPKAHIFDKNELILLWTAEGFLHQPASVNKSPERLGLEYFEEMLSKSFFQHAPNDESLYVMHDLIHDLATSVAGNFFFRLENETKKQVSAEDLEKYRHMSFIREDFGGYGMFKIFERAKSLRTFFAVSIGVIESEKRFYLSNKVLFDLIPQYPLLRVLNLSRFEISVVPDSVGTLKHLRYLNFSKTKISYLPESIGGLYNLQSLLVNGCNRLTKLPTNISKLKNLRHLGINGTALLKKLPSRIGKLTNLQTLTKVIIEGANGFEITELNKLKDLQGKLVIMGLDRVKDALDAKNANIFDKELDFLELNWSNAFDGDRNEIIEQQVFDALKPHNDKLRKLGIASYGGIEFPSWVGDPSFTRLSEVRIFGCKKCKSLPPLGQLPLLKKLFIRKMDEVQVISLEGNFYGGTVAFPSLEVLSFRNMLGWKEWSTKNDDTTRKAFPCLHELSIEGCPNLVQVSLESLPTLRKLFVTICDEVVLRSVVQAAPMLTALQMEDILGMAQLHGVIEYLRAVRQIEILRCDEMRYLWESEAVASKFLVNLEILEVSDCKSIVSFGGKEDGFLTSLRYVKIENCVSLEYFNCPKHVKSLWIMDCGGLTSISFPKGAEELEELVVNCQKLQEDEFGGGSKTASMLTNTSVQTLELLHIIDHPNLKSVIGLSCFIHLTSLIIGACENLESFPDHELSHLTSLTHLAIGYCPNMDESFPRNHGLWPPKLRVLIIGGLKKRISEWGKQNFPTSFVSLMLIGASSDDVGSDGSKLCDLLPSSLTHLHIADFDKLKSLSIQPQYPPSLQHLYISFCPKMRSLRLDQTLVASLLELGIGDCPLQKKCSRKGKGSSFSHIPCIRLEDDDNIWDNYPTVR